jgi:hypothetical protein
MPAEYVCQTCGARAAVSALAYPPDHRLCLPCAFLAAWVPDPGERDVIRRRVDRERDED